MSAEIIIDDRVGSRELLPELKKLHLPCRIERLEFADAAFTGKGKKGKQVKIGIERKTINDLINSMTSGRLSAHQLPGLVQSYDYRWVVVEGLWRPGRDNVIEVWKAGGWRQANTRLSYSQLAGYRHSLEVNGACYTWRTGSLWETANEIGLLYRWWQKDWEEHRGHLAIDKGMLLPDRILFERPSYPRLVAAVLPGIGWKRSKAVAKFFHTIERMVEAGPKEWMQIEGVGKELGVRLPMILRGMRGVQGAREE